MRCIVCGADAGTFCVCGKCVVWQLGDPWQDDAARSHALATSLEMVREMGLIVEPDVRNIPGGY